ncbi:MAG: rhomboid family intramembrane serine protease [Lentisphaerae bacterium]|jgi:membrane associated rhomboid family serine protease|nr:rhomboid family intramembrane serine protease [Lentisphaerota bacterium]
MRLPAIIRSIFYTLRFAPAAVTVSALATGFYLVQRVSAGVEFTEGHTFGEVLTFCFGLHGPLLLKGFVWQFVTYLFLHGGWWHLALNMLTVLLFGSGLEMEIGSKRFWTVFILGGALGGLGWVVLDALQPLAAALGPWLSRLLMLRNYSGVYGTCIGASGGVFALIGAYAALFPRREVTVLILFFPVRMKARTLAIFLGILTVIEAVVVESQIAYAAHLAGGVAGYMYGNSLVRRRLLFRLASRER